MTTRRSSWRALEDTLGDDVVVVGFPLGGHTAALVGVLRPVREPFHLAAMVPEAGVSLNDQVARGDRVLLPDYAAGVDGPDEHGFSRWIDFDVYCRTGATTAQSLSRASVLNVVAARPTAPTATPLHPV